MRGQPGFFDIDDRLKRLSDLGDQLEAFRSAVDFELFRPELNVALSYTERAEGGRPPFDPVLMFKILVIQATNNLSDERAEFLINDRLSFMRFLGLGLEDRVPDARTIWLFREKLTTAGAIKRLFEQFDAMLRQAGYIAMSGQIVDASLVAAPRQRNTDDEKRSIKEGRIPANWRAKPAKLRHKDRDARWTVKFSKAKPRDRQSIWQSRCLAIRTMSRLIAVSALSADGRPQMRLPMRAVICAKVRSTRAIRRAGCGPIPLTDRRPTRRP
jgi:transposase, IS5 family